MYVAACFDQSPALYNALDAANGNPHINVTRTTPTGGEDIVAVEMAYGTKRLPALPDPIHGHLVVAQP